LLQALKEVQPCRLSHPARAVSQTDRSVVTVVPAGTLQRKAPEPRHTIVTFWVFVPAGNGK